MTMNEIINLLPALLAGIGLGIVFFGGLWLTIQKGLQSKKSGLIFTGSFIVRMTVILLGFYYVGANDWKMMLACLAGFLIARVAITLYTKKQEQSKATFMKEVANET